MRRFQGRIAAENFLFGRTLRKAVENYCDRNPRSSCADFSRANIRLAREEVFPSYHCTILSGFPSTGHMEDCLFSRHFAIHRQQTHPLHASVMRHVNDVSDILEVDTGIATHEDYFFRTR